MDANDRIRPGQEATPPPEHFDRLAAGVLRAARDAARELRREPPDPDRRAWALGVLAGQTQAMLGRGVSDHPPVGEAAQEGFVHTALTLALHVRAHSWAKADFGAAGVPGQDDVPHPGERQAADTFDVLGRLMLPNASPEGWTATLATDLARGDTTLEAAVKLGKYVLHPTFLAVTDDTTRIIGEALHNINVRQLRNLIDELRAYADAGSVHKAPTELRTRAISIPTWGDRQSVTEIERPDERIRFQRHPRSPSNDRTKGSGSLPSAPPEPPSQTPPASPRSSKPKPPSTPGPHWFAAPGPEIAPGESPDIEGAPSPQAPVGQREFEKPVIRPLYPQAPPPPPKADEPITTTFIISADAPGTDPDVSLHLDLDPEYRGRDLEGPTGFSL
ncbi:hypothetical protein [Streptomyces sp. NPDC088736]|uniref:hypothetical protein n=1 Tax=Streptomyces sp. NPDC088736 TaxID=3365881 RepID=UPI00380C5728